MFFHVFLTTECNLQCRYCFGETLDDFDEDFADIEVNLLGADSAYIIGRWKITNSSKVREGVFTVIARKLQEGWRIIHDHAS